MARGWESKGIEAQQEAASERRAHGDAMSAEDQARASQRATLMLARARAVADLQRACVSAHRAMLEQAIADLDVRLAALERPVDASRP